MKLQSGHWLVALGVVPPLALDDLGRKPPHSLRADESAACEGTP